MKVDKLVLLLLMFSVFSCQNEPLSPKAYVQWVKSAESGLLRTKEVGGLKMEVLYKPLAYVIANEFKQAEISKTRFEERAKELENLQYYQIRLAVTEREGVDVVNWRVGNTGASEERIQYLSFGMQEHIKLVDGQDTLACVLYHFERSYDVAKFRTFLVGFDAKEELNDKTLILDTPVFQTGPMKVSFDKNIISNIADIKLIP